MRHKASTVPLSNIHALAAGQACQGDATVPGVAKWLRVYAPGQGMPDPHSPPPLWLHIPLGANAGLGLGCCLCKGDEKGESGLRDDNGVKFNLVLPASLQIPPPGARNTLPCCVPLLPVPAAGPAARRWLLTSVGKRSRGNEALCQAAASSLEKAPAAAGRACCAQPLPHSSRGLSPPCALNPQCHRQRGKFPILLKTSPFRGEGAGKNLVQSRQQQQQQGQSPPALKPPPGSLCVGLGRCHRLWGPPNPAVPRPHGSQHGRRVHPCGM